MSVIRGRSLTLSQKVGLMPIVAGLSFVLVLLINEVTGSRNARLISSIQTSQMQAFEQAALAEAGENQRWAVRLVTLVLCGVLVALTIVSRHVIRTTVASLKAAATASTPVAREHPLEAAQSPDDVTRVFDSLHQAMAALTQSEQQLKAAERLAHVGSWQWDEVTSVGTWSDELFRIFGISGRPPSGFGEFIRLVHPDDQAQVKAAVATGYAERRPFQLSFRIVRPDGVIRTLHSHNEVVTGAAGDVAGLRAAVQDVTESENAHRELGESEERYHSLFEDNPHPLWVYEIETLRFLDVNGVASAQYGYSRDEFLAMTILDLHGPDNRDAVLRVVGQAREGRHTSGQWRHKRKDGSLIDVEISSHDTRFGARTARLVLANDITERIRLEDQLRQAQKMDAVGRLAGGVAHDFNNILGVILGYGEMVRRGLPPQDPLQGKVAQILRAGERAAALTRQLLTFSRKQIVQPRILDLNIVMDDMEKMLRPLIGEDVELETVAGQGLSSVEADPSQLEQVILNLAVNARDAMPNGGKLILETQNVALDAAYVRTHTGAQVGPHVMLAVSDTGHGMDPETTARIFEPFFTTKAVGKGTGLGLSTVYGIVTKAGGHVEVYSEKGRGTTFKVYLPSASVVDEVAEVPPSQEAPPTGSETVLVVEDEEALRDVVRDVLEQAGYRVITAVGPAEAITAAGHNGGIDVVLTDVVMPAMNGPDLVRNLAPLVRGARAVFMSGYTDDAIGHHGLIDPDVLFLQKPFTAEQLLWKIRDAVSGSGSLVRS